MDSGLPVLFLTHARSSGGQGNRSGRFVNRFAAGRTGTSRLQSG